jgi:peptidoglycan/LPS O-acetylase OafA/YrhL
MAPVLRIAIWACDRPHLRMVDSWTFTRMDSIAVGCLLALCAAAPSFRKRFQVSDERAAGLTALAVGILIASLVASQRALFSIALGYTINAVAIAAIIWICISRERSVMARFLDWRPLGVLGTLSYSLYLWQQLFLNPHNTGWSCRWPINLCFALLAAGASHLLVEAPFLRLKERRSASHPTDRTAVTATPPAQEPADPTREGLPVMTGPMA